MSRRKLTNYHFFDMKPRTKKQKEVAESSSKLPSLSEAVKKWAIAKVVEHYARRTSKLTTCFDCGYQFDEGGLIVDKTAVCPRCGRKVTILYGRYKKRTSDRYFNIITTIKGFQVVRIFEIIASYRIYEKPSYFFKEVVQNWIDASGVITRMAAIINMQGYFALSSNLSIKPNYNIMYETYGINYPIKRVLPIIKRNGYNGHLYDINPTNFFVSILKNPHAETLLKAEQYDLLYDYCYGSYQKEKLDNVWNVIKICLRNKYIVKDAGMYLDHLGLLDRIGLDRHNAKYVCPANLERTHTLMVERQQKKDEERRRIDEEWRRIEKAKSDKEYDESYKIKKGNFLDMMFHKGKLEIEPLKSVSDFYEEGKAMHHCVYQCGYYKKDDSLILSARLEGQRIETVEVSLSKMEIVQSRGVCNKSSEYHDEIINLVNEHLIDINHAKERV